MKKFLTITALFLIILMGIAASANAQNLKMNTSKMAATLNVTPNPYTFVDTFIGETSDSSFTF